MSLSSIVAAVHRTVSHLLYFHIAVHSFSFRRESAKAETETAPSKIPLAASSSPVESQQSSVSQGAHLHSPSSSSEPEETVVYTGEACSHVSQNGISFHFPASESKCRVELRYKVVDDDYVLPEGYEDMPLVSSMFEITTSDDLPVPVTVRMEHCAIIEEDDSLVHMIAHGPPPYQFRSLPEGKFPLGECYGEIELKRFCTLTQAQKRRGPLSLSVYIVYHSYCSETFVATKNLPTLIRAVKKRYADAIEVVEQSMSCDHSIEAITLRIPRPKRRGWCVRPKFEPPKIVTRLIREYRVGKTPPNIHLKMKWTGEGEPVEEDIRIAVGGTSVIKSFFLLCKPSCVSDSRLSASLSLSPQSQSAPFSPISPQLSLTSSNTPHQSQTPTSLHTPPTDTPHLPQPTDTPPAQRTDTIHLPPLAQHAADHLGLSAESRALRRSNTVFTRGVDPENLVTVLYSNFLLTPEEKARAMKQTLTIGQQLEEIFQSLERRVSTTPRDFKKIIRALMAEPALRAVGDEMQGEF